MEDYNPRRLGLWGVKEMRREILKEEHTEEKRKQFLWMLEELLSFNGMKTEDLVWRARVKEKPWLIIMFLYVNYGI
jgi:hypothetical protein